MRSLVTAMTFATLLGIAGEVSAITEEMEVTPAYVKSHPGEFSIQVKKGDDGLIHFTVTRHLSQPRYLVGHFEVRDQHNAVVAKYDSPAFVREKKATYYFTVSPKYLSRADFEVSESGFNAGPDGTTPFPWVGGEIYKIHLADFAPGMPSGSGQTVGEGK